MTVSHFWPWTILVNKVTKWSVLMGELKFSVEVSAILSDLNIEAGSFKAVGASHPFSLRDTFLWTRRTRSSSVSIPSLGANASCNTS